MDRKRRGDMLTVGSVVLLSGGNRKVVISSRYALFDKNGVQGYFDYCGFFYPEGIAHGNVCYFNEEDIRECLFEGYYDSMENEYIRMIESSVEAGKYKKLTLDDVKIRKGF